MAFANLMSTLPSLLLAPPVGSQEAPKDYRSVDSPHTDYSSQAPWLTPSSDVKLAGRLKVLQAHERIYRSLSDIAGGESPAGNPAVSGVPGSLSAPEGGLPADALAEPPWGVPLPPSPPLSQVQLEGDHVQVVKHGVQQPLVRVSEQGRLEGDRGVIESYVAADEAYRLHADALGRDFSFADGRKLTVSLDDVRAVDAGPSQQPGRAVVQLPPEAAFAANDPDVVAHETAHAVLDAHRPELFHGGDGAAELDEAFADTTAMLTALRDPAVRADVIAKAAAGQRSNLASSIGEGYNQVIQAQDEEKAKKPPAPLSNDVAGSAAGDSRTGAEAELGLGTTGAQGQEPPTPAWQRLDTPIAPLAGNERAGLRDLSDAAPTDDFAEEHEASRRFSSATYQSVLDVAHSMRAHDPGLTEDEALKRAAQRVGSDFSRTLDFLPVGMASTQSDLAQAMIKADRIDQGGELAAIYQRNFEAAGLQPVTEASSGRDARTQAMGRDASLTLPAGLQQAEAFKTLSEAPAASTGHLDSAIGQPARQRPEVAPTPVQAMATAYLREHADALGLDKSVSWQAHELQHNNRGETFIYFSNGTDRYDVSATDYAALGFDRDGRVIHVSQGAGKERPAPGSSQPLPGLATDGALLPAQEP